MAKLTKTSTPGIFRRHAKDCGGGRCECPYVVVGRHRGKQFKTTHRTMAEAREAKGGLATGVSRPTAKIMRALFVEPRDAGASTSEIKKLRAALSALFSTAVEDGVLRSSPTQGVRIPAASWVDEDDSQEVKAMTREELGLVLAALPSKHQLFFDLLSHTGLRISEAVGLTWEHLALGDQPRIKVREQIYRGKRRRLKTKASKRDFPLSPKMADASWRTAATPSRGRERRSFSRRASCAGRKTGPPFRSLRRTSDERSCTRSGGCRVALGHLPRLPAYLRSASVRPGPQCQAGAGGARSHRSEFHAPPIRSPDGRRHRRRSNP